MDGPFSVSLQPVRLPELLLNATAGSNTARPRLKQTKSISLSILIFRQQHIVDAVGGGGLRLSHFPIHLDNVDKAVYYSVKAVSLSQSIISTSNQSEECHVACHVI